MYPPYRTGSPYAEPHVYGNIGRRRSDTSSVSQRSISVISLFSSSQNPPSVKDETRSRSDLSNSLNRADRDQRNRVAGQPSQVSDHLDNDRRAHEDDLNKISNSIHQLRDDLLPASQLHNHPPSQVPTIVLGVSASPLLKRGAWRSFPDLEVFFPQTRRPRTGTIGAAQNRSLRTLPVGLSLPPTRLRLTVTDATTRMSPLMTLSG